MINSAIHGLIMINIIAIPLFQPNIHILAQIIVISQNYISDTFLQAYVPNRLLFKFRDISGTSLEVRLTVQCTIVIK